MAHKLAASVLRGLSLFGSPVKTKSKYCLMETFINDVVMYRGRTELETQKVRRSETIQNES